MTAVEITLVTEDEEREELFSLPLDKDAHDDQAIEETSGSPPGGEEVRNILRKYWCGG